MSHDGGVLFLLKTKTHVDKLKYMLIFTQKPTYIVSFGRQFNELHFYMT